MSPTPNWNNAGRSPSDWPSHCGFDHAGHLETFGPEAIRFDWTSVAAPPKREGFRNMGWVLFSRDSGRPDDRLAGRSSFIGHPGAKHFSENSERGKRKDALWKLTPGSRQRNKERGYLWMDLSLGTNPEVSERLIRQNGMPASTSRFGLGP